LERGHRGAVWELFSETPLAKNFKVQNSNPSNIKIAKSSEPRWKSPSRTDLPAMGRRKTAEQVKMLASLSHLGEAKFFYLA
jgi:hypothetical protein